MLGTEFNLHTKSGNDDIVMVIPIKAERIQLFDKETNNNLIWYDKDSAEADAPICKNYNF